MNLFNLNYIAIFCMAIFLGIGFFPTTVSHAFSLEKSSIYLILSDSTKSDSTKKDSTHLTQLIEVTTTKKEVELKPQNQLQQLEQDSIFAITDKAVQYSEGDIELFYKFITQNLTYPEEARKQKLQSKIYVRFVVNKDGSVSKAESVKGNHDILKREAERVVSLTKWIPAQIKGQNVRSLMTIPITFMLAESQKIVQSNTTNEEVDIAIVDEVPTFEGGMDNFYTYISQNLTYPKTAKRLGEQGRVIVKCIVEKDGTLSNFEILQSVSPACDEETLRVVKNSPAWIPAKKDGQAVKTSISFPIVFKLD